MLESLPNISATYFCRFYEREKRRDKSIPVGVKIARSNGTQSFSQGIVFDTTEESSVCETPLRVAFLALIKYSAGRHSTCAAKFPCLILPMPTNFDLYISAAVYIYSPFIIRPHARKHDSFELDFFTSLSSMLII